jgi:hypothetical protein
VASVRSSAVLVHRRAPLLFIFQQVGYPAAGRRQDGEIGGELAIIRGQTGMPAPKMGGNREVEETPHVRLYQ